MSRALYAVLIVLLSFFSTVLYSQAADPPAGGSLLVANTGYSSAADFRALSSLLASSRYEPTSRVVTTAADSGPGSLRDMLSAAQDGDTISFDPNVFPPAAPSVIQLISPLPALTQNDLTLDASRANVVLDGSALAGGPADGLDITGSRNRILGLQIVSFPGNGIVLHGGARSNQIGGDPQTGSAPTGQGNLISNNGGNGIALLDSGTSDNVISGNRIGSDLSGTQAWGNHAHGIEFNGASDNLVEGNLISGNFVGGVDLCCTPETRANVIRANHIGTDLSGSAPLPNQAMGVYVQHGATANTIGPDNVIAYNGSAGIEVWGSRSPANTITRNSIHDNQGNGITLWGENIDLLPVPVVTSFDRDAGSISGLSCPDCLVEVFSDPNNEGQLFEGEVRAGANGTFALTKGAAFAGPHVTATTTDASGTTSMFSTPTTGVRSLALQLDNPNPFTRVTSRTSAELADNFIATTIQGPWVIKNGMADAYILNQLGVKRANILMNDPDSNLVVWEEPETAIHPVFDTFVSGLVEAGITPTYDLTFWDKEAHGGVAPSPAPRFKTEEEINRYLDFVRLIVGSFGDRVDCYEIFNEPSYANSYQWIEVEDYINLAKRAIPLIRELDPGAKIAVGSFHGWDDGYYQQYLYRVLQSDLMPLVDVVSWHPYIGVLTNPECGQDHYYRYEQILEEIKALATANGFSGEFRALELHWSTPDVQSGNPCTCYDRTCAKYYMRGITLHRAHEVATGYVLSDPASTRALQIIATLMAEAHSADLGAQVDSPAPALKVFGFAYPSGEKLLVLWSDQPVTDEDPAFTATVRLPGVAGAQVSALDPLGGFEQALVAHADGADLVVENLQLRDYPLFLRVQ